MASAHDGRRRVLGAQPVIAVQLESSSSSDRHPRYIIETAIPPVYGRLWLDVLTPACCLAAQS